MRKCSCGKLQLGCSIGASQARGVPPKQRVAARPAASMVPPPANRATRSLIQRSALSADALVSIPTTAASDAADLWASFAAAASGEWDGIAVTFDRDGEAQELPEYYVPQAYRDWGVKIHDWQSQCSMLADEEGMRYSLRRLMPTVGCEADAIAFVEEQQQLFPAQQAADTALAADGAYSHGPEALSSQELFQAAVEHCLPLAPGQRLRVVHNLKRMGVEREWVLLGVELHRERRDGPHTGRRELSGCGGGMELFSQQPPLEAAALDGAWVASGEHFQADGSGAVVHSSVEGQAWTAAVLHGLVGLPLGAWSSVSVHGDEATLAAGVILDDATMRASVRRMSGGRLQRAELLTVRRI